jgi:hypothetical protein
MVCTRTSDFALEAPEVSDARARAASTEPHGATPELRPLPPLPPPPLLPVSLEQLLAT